MEPMIAADWKTLRFAVLWTFEAVAAADGTVDAREERTLHETLARWSACDEPLLRKVATSVSDSYETVKDDYHADARNIDQGLRDALKILRKKASPATVDRFRSELLTLAKDVANASGGIFGFGNKTSVEEQAALEKLRSALGIES